MLRVNSRLAQGIGGKQGIEEMVAPLPCDAQVGTRIAFPDESHPFKQPDRGDIVGEAGRLYAPKSKCLEDEGRESPDGVRHMALAGIRLPHPIAEGRRL